MSSHFRLEAVADLAPLREAFKAAGFNATNLAATLAVQSLSENMDVPLMLLRTEEPTPYHTLIRLFVLEQAVPENEARKALCPMPLEILLDCNLLQRGEAGLRSTVKLVPHEKFFFVSDFSYRGKPESFPPDFVLGVGPSSVTLACLTIRKPAQSGLDVGAGAGVQAVLASEHVKKIVGTDTNPRAANFARFNALLNGLDNIEWRMGNFFDPARDEHFDLVMANPPFVVSPESSYLYRDGGGQGDAVSEHVVRGAAERLKDGGFASMLINWHHKNGEDWPERPLQWMAGNGCDSWLLRFSESDPFSYAATWLRSTEGKDPQRYSRLLREWTSYYQKCGMGKISSGSVIMRKRKCAKNWTRHDSMQRAQGGGPCGEHILRVFAAEDYLQQMENDGVATLLDQRIQPHPDLTLEQELVLEDGAWTIRNLTIKLERGIPFTGWADAQLLKFMARSASKPTVRETIDFLSDQAGENVAEITPTCLEVVKKLIRCGMLVPV